MDDLNLPLPNDSALDEDRNEEDRLLRDRGIRSSELSPGKRKDLVDDMRGSAMDDDDEKPSDVTTPE